MTNIKTILACTFAVLLFTGLQAQDRQKKSAKYKSLSERNIDTDQSVPSLLEEARQLMSSDPSAALDLVEQALATSITQQSSFNEAKCYLVLGKINESQGEFKLANQNYIEAYQRLSRAYTKTVDYQETLDGLGDVNFKLGNYNESKQFYERLLQVEIGEKKRLEVELRLAEIEVELGQTPQARERVSQLEPSATYIQSNTLQSKGRAVKARAYAKEDNFAAAEETLSPMPAEAEGMSMDIVEADDFEEIVIEDLEAEELINIYQQQNKKEEEIALREKIAVSKVAEKKPLQATKQRQAIGKVLIDQGRTSEAIVQLEQAAVLADSTGNVEEQANAYLALAEAYSKIRAHDQALKAYEKYSEATTQYIAEQQTKESLRETLLRKQQDIQALTKDLALDESSYLLEATTTELQAQQLRSQRLLIYGLLAVLMIVVVAAYFIYRKAQEIKRVGQLLALKSLRSQMNPHFIFNALNSVNQFVALNDERAANRFLAEFSKLMRMVLDNSQKEFITMREEKEMLALYLKLEHYRFRDQFDYQFEVDEELDLDEIEIPPMLIQPYIENAIWHGLRYKMEKGNLNVKVYPNGNTIKVRVEDDGIGRSASAHLKTDNQKKKNSVGLKNTQERIGIINRVYHTNYALSIMDVNEDQSGTRVEISIPTNHG